MTAFAVVSAVAGGCAFAALAALILIAPGGGGVGRLLVAASFGNVVLFAGMGLYAYLGSAGESVLVPLQLAEILRDTGWLVFLGGILVNAGDSAYRRKLAPLAAAFAVLAGIAMVLVVAPYAARRLFDADPAQIRRLYLLVNLLFALGGLALTEHLFRSTAIDHRWSIKHLCFGVGLMFAYDFYLYANAVLFNGIDAAIWSARGVVNALAVPLIALSASRNRDWALNIFVSRRVVFQGVTMAAAGTYLIIMAAAGYYIQVFGGEWGRALKIAFFFAALVLLLSLLFSAQLRSRVRLFLARHFYRNKYEYGDEWLKFTAALAGASLDPASLYKTILRTVADIVDSPGGMIFKRLATGGYGVAEYHNVYRSFEDDIPPGAAFTNALRDRESVWDLGGEYDAGDSARSLTPPGILALQNVGFIVPIAQNDELLAFLVLARPRSNAGLDEEDRDLLATVGKQAASYLALLDASDALSESRQFETFNRLSAFLVHDLKNVVAQLSLIVRNAERHGDKREFIDDAFQTVGDAVDKMNRMLSNLRQMQVDVTSDDEIDLNELCTEAIDRKADNQPRPTLDKLADEHLIVHGPRERLLSVVEHLLQNAVDATDEGGEVCMGTAVQGNKALLSIRDTGCGMSRDFIRHRCSSPLIPRRAKPVWESASTRVATWFRQCTGSCWLKANRGTAPASPSSCHAPKIRPNGKPRRGVPDG